MCTVQNTAVIAGDQSLEEVLEKYGKEFELRDSLFPAIEDWTVNPLLFLDPMPPPTPPPPTTPPDPPVILDVTSASETISVSWRAPENNGGMRIRSYSTWLVYTDPDTSRKMMIGRETIRFGHPDVDGPPPESFALDFTELINGITCVAAPCNTVQYSTHCAVDRLALVLVLLLLWLTLALVVQISSESRLHQHRRPQQRGRERATDSL